MDMINAATRFGGATAVPVKGSTHVHSSKWCKHVLMRALVCSKVCASDLPSEVDQACCRPDCYQFETVCVNSLAMSWVVGHAS